MAKQTLVPGSTLVTMWVTCRGCSCAQATELFVNPFNIPGVSVLAWRELQVRTHTADGAGHCATQLMIVRSVDSLRWRFDMPDSSVPSRGVGVPRRSCSPDNWR